MRKKAKIKPEEKVQAAQDYIEGRISQSEAARRLGIGRTSVTRWVARYEAEGSLGLIEPESNRKYSEELRRQAVTEYLAGSGSLEDICKKYKIRSNSQLRTWIKVYNSGRDFKRKMSGGSFRAAFLKEQSKRKRKNPGLSGVFSFQLRLL